MSNLTNNMEKTIAAFLYVSKILAKKNKSDMHSVFKALYFAEEQHLAKYGRMITNDRFIAMRDGPVPSYLYDKCKDSKTSDNDIFVVSDVEVIPYRSADMDELSFSDIECLNHGVETVKDLDYPGRKNKSHDNAYNKAWNKRPNSKISVIEMAKVGGADNEIIAFLNE